MSKQILPAMRNFDKTYWENYDLIRNILKLYALLAISALLLFFIALTFNAEMLDTIVSQLLP